MSSCSFPVHHLVLVVHLGVGVHLEVHGQPLHPLLQREVGGEALDSQGQEGGLLQRVPVHR